MAITAIDSKSSYVMLVAELNRLLSRDAGLSYVGRSIYFVRDPSEESNDKNGSENAEFRDCVGARMENLRHLSTLIQLELRQTGTDFRPGEAEALGYRF
jgi:hypothetical protein